MESSMKLREFRSQLQKIEKRLPRRISWPFLCHESPLICRIFIVGANPARQVEKPFWSFWNDSRGFRKAEFIRKLEELPDGLTRTRKYIEIVADAAGPRDTLETNIYPYAKPRARDLTAEEKRTDVFEFLLHTIKPRVVLAHGDEAKKFFSERGITLMEDRLKTINLDGLRIKLLPRKHLSYQTSYKEARKIGRALARALV
jgi:uracil-DNA glycosylase